MENTAEYANVTDAKKQNNNNNHSRYIEISDATANGYGLILMKQGMKQIYKIDF